MPRGGFEPPLPVRELAPEASASASSATSAACKARMLHQLDALSTTILLLSRLQAASDF